MSQLFMSDTLTLSNLQAFFVLKATFHNVAQAFRKTLNAWSSCFSLSGAQVANVGHHAGKHPSSPANFSLSSFPSFTYISSTLLSVTSAVVPRAFLYSYDFNHHSSHYMPIPGGGAQTSLIFFLMSTPKCPAVTSHTLLTLKCIQVCSACGTISSQEPNSTKAQACDSLPPSLKSDSELYPATPCYTLV